jgi:hypothetical protein
MSLNESFIAPGSSRSEASPNHDFEVSDRQKQSELEIEIFDGWEERVGQLAGLKAAISWGRSSFLPPFTPAFSLEKYVPSSPLMANLCPIYARLRKCLRYRCAIETVSFSLQGN